MTGRKFFILIALLSFGIFVVNSCLEPFNPNIPAKDVGFLVVEGYINADTGVTRIQLTRVSALEESNLILYEEGAEVWIESNLGETFMLSEKGQGIYLSDTLILPIDRQYRLVVNRNNDKTYTSELMPVKVTPSIDSLHWEWKDQLYIYANSHDISDATRFYTWTFREDWEIKSQYQATLQYVKDRDTLTLLFPSDALRMHDCWGKATSTKTVFASTQQLTQDAISYPITVIPASSEKIQYKYSIWAYQRTMTEDEYNYMILVKKNSEQTGSFFDPMPSQLFGNIHREGNMEELVVGYVGVYTTEKLRLFIDKDELPPHPVQEKCPPEDFEFTPVNLETYLSNPTVFLPYQTYFENGNPSKPRVVALPAVCLDCRFKPGASSVHPDWEPEP